MFNISRSLVLTGAVLFIYGLILCLRANLNFGVVFIAVLGGIILFTGVFYNKISSLTENRFFRIGKIVLIVFLCAEIGLVAFIGIYGMNDRINYSEDAIIVLGAGVRGDKVTFPLKMRLDKAIEYHHKNPEALIVVTGGKGLQETVTEAYAMEKYLIENGVDKKIILKEEKAVSTYENIKFSKKILDGCLTDEYSVVVITNHFHIFRGVTMAKRSGLKNVSHIHAGLQWYNFLPCFLRESLAVIKMLVLS